MLRTAFAEKQGRRKENFKFSFPSSAKSTNNSGKNCTVRAEAQFNNQDGQIEQCMEKEDEQSLEQILSRDAPPFTAKGGPWAGWQGPLFPQPQKAE